MYASETVLRQRENDDLEVSTMPEITTNQVEQFLKELMEIERRYANERTNQNSDRRQEIREHLDRFSARELGNEDS